MLAREAERGRQRPRRARQRRRGRPARARRRRLCAALRPRHGEPALQAAQRRRPLGGSASSSGRRRALTPPLPPSFRRTMSSEPTAATSSEAVSGPARLFFPSVSFFSHPRVETPTYSCRPGRVLRDGGALPRPRGPLRLRDDGLGRARRNGAAEARPGHRREIRLQCHPEPGPGHLHRRLRARRRRGMHVRAAPRGSPYTPSSRGVIGLTSERRRRRIDKRMTLRDGQSAPIPRTPHESPPARRASGAGHRTLDFRAFQEYMALPPRSATMKELRDALSGLRQVNRARSPALSAKRAGASLFCNLLTARRQRRTRRASRL